MENQKENHHSKDTITINKQDLWKYSTFILAAILIIGAFAFFVQGDSTTNTNTGGQQVPSANQRVEIDLGDAPILGDEDAPVTIVEFSDYQCPFCRKFWAESYDSIKKNYVDTGKVKIAFMDFPLSFHAMAQKSAEAARCVREKGGDSAYYEMHDKMFEEQMVLDGGVVRSTVSYTNEDLKQWAKELGYDIGSCLDSGKYQSAVQKDFNYGSSIGVQGTPGFFVNGQPISGAQPYEVFKQLIEAEL